MPDADEGSQGDMIQRIPMVGGRSSVADAYLRFLAENTTDILSVADRRGVIVYESPAVERALGYRPEEMVGRCAVEFIHPDDADRSAAVFDEAEMNPSEPFQARHRFRHRDGTYRTLAGEVRLAEDANGERVYVTLFHDVTESTSLAEQARDANDFMEHVFAATPSLGLAVYDESGQCVLANEAISRTVGVAREHMLSLNFHRIPSWRSTGMDRMAIQVLEDGDERRIETRMITSGRRDVWVECRCNRITWKGRNHLLLLLQDISARRRAEWALRRNHEVLENQVAERTAELEISQQRLRSILDAITESALLISSTGVVLETNETNARRLGSTVEEMVGTRLDRYIPPGLFEDRMARVKTVCETGQPLQFADERAGVHVFHSIYPVFDQDGKVTQLAIFGVDMTPQLEAERQLAEAEQRMAQSFEASSANMALILPDGRFNRVNQAFARCLGYERDELERMRVADITRPDDLADATAQGRRLLQGQTDSVRIEMRFVHKSGHAIPVRTTSTAIRDQDGGILYYFTIAEDISQRLAAEAQVQKTLAELKRSNAELEQFAYIASHDLSEPLRKVMAFGERLKATCGPELDESCQDYLSRMLNATQRMQRMIDGLLALSRVTTHSRPFVETDLTEIARDALATLEIAAEESKTQVEIGPLPSAEVDALQIHQLLQNLLHNGIRFRREGVTPFVRVSGGVVEDEKAPMVEVRVADNGIGFEEKHLDRIFLPFHCLHGPDKYEGSGIGLAVCRKIVERHGGSITARSTPGEGTVFVVRLPRRHPHDEMPAAALPEG